MIVMYCWVRTVNFCNRRTLVCMCGMRGQTVSVHNRRRIIDFNRITSIYMYYICTGIYIKLTLADGGVKVSRRLSAEFKPKSLHG